MNDPTPAGFRLSMLGRSGASTFVWGESRAVVNRLLFAMARAVDPEPIWLDLAPGEETAGGEPGPAELGWIPKERLFLVLEPDQARPQDAVANMALLNVIRADEPKGAIERLADFVRLAPIAQEVISRTPAQGPRRALAVANSDRVRPDYPHTVRGIEPIVSALVDAALCPFIGAQGTPGEGRMAFTYVFQVQASGLLGWRDGRLIPERVPDDSPVRAHLPIPLTGIPGLETVFDARKPPK